MSSSPKRQKAILSDGLLIYLLGMICKPNSVSRRYRDGNHLSGPQITLGLEHSTRLYCDERRTACMSLHPVRFALPPNVTTGAVSSYFTFSPFPSQRIGKVVYFLWHWLSRRLGIFPLGSTVLVGVRTFLPPRVGDYPIIPIVPSITLKNRNLSTNEKDAQHRIKCCTSIKTVRL